MSQGYNFRVAPNTIGKIVPETCKAIFTALKGEFFRCPRTAEEWKNIADGFYTRWNFPNTIGAIDGKHIVLTCPKNTGSKFFNYKGSFSIVLMALVDSEYRFTYVNIGKQGRISDGGVFGHCSLFRALIENKLNLPPPSALPGDTQKLPFFLVGDEAFPLRKFLMKPYPQRNLSHDQRIFNYRLSRARRIVENAFGILASRFRIFLKPINVSPERAELMVLAACTLQNMLRHFHPLAVLGRVDREDPVTHEIIPGSWRSEITLERLPALRGNNATKASKAQRDYLCDYVNSDVGKIAWQEDMI
jgi:hypothetical protein